MHKKLSSITKEEWIKYDWVEVLAYIFSGNREFINAGLRTLDQQDKSLRDWASMEEIKNK